MMLGRVMTSNSANVITNVSLVINVGLLKQEPTLCQSPRILDAFPERIFSLSLSEIGKPSMLCFI